MAFSLSEAGVTFAAIYLSVVVYTVTNGRPARRYVDQLRKRGLVHAVTKLPSDAVIDNMITAVSRDFPETDMFYLDFWPLSVPTHVITNPEAAIQANQMHNLDKPPLLHDLMMDLAGGPHMFMTSEKDENYILSLVPRIVEEVSTYSEMLRSRADDGNMFSLDEATLRLTFDLIGRTVLDSKLGYQGGPNPLADAMRSQIFWHSFGNEVNPWTRWHPLGDNRYIGEELDKRYAEKRNAAVGDKNRSVISLALDSYLQDTHTNAESNKMDDVLRRYATYQIRIFLFAGHDSTSTTICYCYYLLSKNPEAMALIRKEHNEVLGTDVSSAAAQISAKPNLLNKLPYTTAVIKETLRPSSMRLGRPGVELTDRHGARYPEEGCHVWILHMALHRNPRYWPEPNAFKPERWLVGPEHPLHPAKGAWRPFEHGIRNYIGQTLAMVNVKTLLALTLTEFDVKDAYVDWDATHPTRNLKRVDGERAYCTERGGMHPADGFPCKVLVRDRE
ncbi:cytochrome P450 [Bimuria novae-zelandiae CBS 107.79]|uniref:Cytochrome P450 n=1 Tax=Bimuria novae-zelandiae CBS 107.79 TaxID=1447943 RepID=A0A6A5VQ45_9PLEO|nr:cytochrome P450 [Bimuria novae-zelandiae CBS 107.79]